MIVVIFPGEAPNVSSSFPMKFLVTASEESKLFKWINPICGDEYKQDKGMSQEYGKLWSLALRTRIRHMGSFLLFC